MYGMEWGKGSDYFKELPITIKYKVGINPNNGTEIRSNGYGAMRKTNLKEMYIVRYAYDFRIFCRTKTDAEKTKIAITQWLKEQLKLEKTPRQICLELNTVFSLQFENIIKVPINSRC